MAGRLLTRRRVCLLAVDARDRSACDVLRNHPRKESNDLRCRCVGLPDRCLDGMAVAAVRPPMTSALPHGCKAPGCPAIIASGPYCLIHTRTTYRDQDARRPNSRRRGYTAEWEKIRKRFLLEHPLCVVCGREATQVDHRIPLSAGGTHDEANLQAMCVSHHSSKTMRELNGRRQSQSKTP